MAFHPYPRLIPSVFNRSGFGPPQGLTPASAWPRVDHPASRLRRATGRVALFRLAFAAARQSLGLAARRNSQAHSTKGTPSRRLQRGAPTACGRTVSGAVSLPSRGAFHLSLTVLVHYRSSGSVQPWRAVPPASARVSRARAYSGTCRGGRMRFAYGALTRYRRPSHAVPLRVRFATSREGSTPPLACPATPAGQRVEARRRRRFGLARFRSPLLARSRLISLPRGTWMFRFPRLPRPALCVRAGAPGHGPGRVAPFGDPRIEGRLRLPAAYRSLPRPSSAPDAKASTVRPRHLPVPRNPPKGYLKIRSTCSN